MAEEDLELVYLTLEDALELYAAIVDRNIAHAAAALRAPSTLEGALARPASYALLPRRRCGATGRCARARHRRRSPFLDGNKRLALVAMLTFLEANGHRVDAADPELAEWVIGLSAGLTPEQPAERIRPLLIPATSR